MTKIRTCAVAVLLSWVFLGSIADTQGEPERQMVLTFDDLPYQTAGYSDTLLRGRRVTDKLLRTLAKYQAPTTAFVNESKLFINDETKARIGLLEMWVEYGAVIGNHTYSHSDLNLLSVEEFEREIIDGEPITLKLMSSREPYQRFFRHPYTHTGDTEDKKVRISAFLHERNYQIAPYTIDSQDSIFNHVYLDAKQSKNDELADQIQDAYVDFVVSTTEFAERISVEIFGDEIPQTLILHSNDINADSLDGLLDRLVQRSYRFVNLTNAMQHPAYSTTDKLVTSYGPSWLWRWSKSMEMDVSFRGDPEPPDWILEMFEESNSSEP